MADIVLPPRSRPSHRRSLFQQVKRARLWLPIAIVGVVLIHQLIIVPLGGERWQFWIQLLFYSILGPIVTYITLNWIAREIRLREKAQDELARLYSELQASHKLLAAIQKVTEKFAAAPDLEATLKAACTGITGVTRARGAAVLLGSGTLAITHDYGLSPTLVGDAVQRDGALLTGKSLREVAHDGPQAFWVLSMPVLWAGSPEGSVHAYFTDPPLPEQREGFNILASQFSSAAEASRNRTRDLLTFFDVDRSIRAEGNLEHLLATLLSHMMNRSEATLGGVYLADEDQLLQLRADRGLRRSSLPATVRLGVGILGRFAEAAEPGILNSLSDEPDDEGDYPVGRVGSLVALPLLLEDELLGLVVLAHYQPDHFEEAALPFLSLLSSQVSLAVGNARAYLQSEELAIAEERARIAREIHDGVAQSLALSALKLDLVSRLVEGDPGKAKKEVIATRSALRELIKEVRRSIFALRPVDLERHGFVETVRRYCHDYGQQNDVQIDLRVEKLPELVLQSEATLFRIFQEAMNNVAKHAAAHSVTVRLGLDVDGQAYLEVKDDGKGFDINKVSDRVTSAGGLGLRQMRERIESRGGHFEIGSQPGRGTRVFASLPE